MSGDGEGRSRRRTLGIALASVLAAAAVFTVAMRMAPGAQEDVKAAASPAGTSAVPAPSTKQAAPTRPPASHTPVPTESGSRFEPWVDDVARWLDIPRPAMHAYATATARLSEESPRCNLSWVTLAGVGKTTTDHGRVGGGQITEDGTVSEPISTVEFRDFSGKVISQPGSAGPLQLSPSVWQRWAASASGDQPDVQDIDDAALTAGRALCAQGRDLSDGDDWLAGVARLHPAPLFLHRVLATANVYGTVGQSGREPNPAALTAVTFAIEKIGLPYVWGGNGTEHGDAGFDCSGLTTAAYAEAGVELLRTAHTQYNSVPHVPEGEEPRLGDLIFYGDPATKIHHVGLYIGNQQMIDAPTFGQAVQVHNYRTPGDDYAGAGRPTG
ncbi:cell wall-associated hydrolase, invasion-associated protein [Saccharomonospora marina XMU15]|uniref:Cell wall-associated hydrolase, invasion-associated protein n=1 Tax=Saccharomonospora marina XMU15 TaxID=882083 RepID=H5X2U7_9PSEU|nr:C40 family peptidase [Saccharomonospora marina]EHR52089.1 cell wall-associated hydrolase, invasion-associated protein [Saccharomonospora marina XMU15]